MPTAPNTPLLEVRGLTHTFEQGRSGIFDLDFSVSKGEFILLAGPNGCGKTTLIKHLVGLIQPEKGQVTLAGKDIFKDLIQTRRRIGMVFQDADTQIVGETVYSEVAFGPENLGLPVGEIRTGVERILKDLDLYPFRDQHPASLSGGEKRRLTIAGILAMNPEIILFDEPFANLDYPSSCRLVEIITNLHKGGRTIIMATHEMDLVLGRADRIIIMEAGKIRAEGSLAQMAPEFDRFGLKPWCPVCQKEGL